MAEIPIQFEAMRLLRKGDCLPQLNSDHNFCSPNSLIHQFFSTVSTLTVPELEGSTDPGPAELMHVAKVACWGTFTGKMSPGS